MDKVVRIIIAGMVFFAAAVVVSGAANAFSEPKAALLVSLKIKPYMDAVSGLEAVFEEQQLSQAAIFFLEDYTDEGDALQDLLKNDQFDVLVAVGPEAARLLWGEEAKGSSAKRIYAMILNPEKIIDPLQLPCGVPLSISPATQLADFESKLPGMKRIGLLFDPLFNTSFVQDAVQAGKPLGVTIVALPVSSKQDIPIVLDDQWRKLDGLWLIPDRTVISESLVKYIIKQGISHRVPVIGYNRFFYDNGAALVLAFDYEAIGRQAGILAIRSAKNEACESVVPGLNILLNERVLKQIGVDFLPDENSVEATSP